MVVAYVPDTELSVDEINLAQLDFWLRDDVDGALAKLRRERPIAWHEHPDCGKGFWSVTRYADIAAISVDTATFSNRWSIRVNHDPEMGLTRPGSSSIIEMDPPQHTKYRKLVSRGFTPRRIGLIEDHIRARARALVDSVAPKGSCEFVTEIAARLPLEVICDLVGVPSQDHDYIFKLSSESFGEYDPEVGVTPEQGSAAAQELKAYGCALAEERRRNPKDDLITLLVEAEVDGHRLTQEEIGGFFSLLLAAGSETTRSAISHGLVAFSRFPEQKRLFLEDCSAWAPFAAEEILRWATPILHMRRTVTREVDFGGVRMREGDKVAMWYISANRDESVFPDPYRFDITRDPNRHGAFGTGGPHFCLGHNLARREIAVLFEELFRLLPDIEVVGEPVKLRSNQFHGIKRLHAVFTPVR